MNRYKTTALSILFLLLLFTCSCSAYKDINTFVENEDVKGLGVYTTDYSLVSFNEELSNNKLIAWGIRRMPGGQPPEVSSSQAALLEKYRGKYIGNTSRKVVYLTFDEGYENGYTPQILDTLKKYNAKAIFFITGQYLKKEQELVRRMVEEGHEVGNHTVHHPSLPGISDDKVESEVIELDRAFSERFGRNMRFLRPPKGEFSERTLAITNGLGYVNLMWSFAYDDWNVNKQRGWEYAYNITTKNIHNGAVLLLHAVSRDNAEALGSIIQSLQEKGYTVGNPAELLAK